MKIIIVSFITGIVAALIMALCAVVQKKMGEKSLTGAGGILVILSYAVGHILLSGLPPLGDRGFNMSTEHWNLFLAIAAFIPAIAAEYLFRARFLKYAVRFAFMFTGLFLILQVPYVSTAWSSQKSILVLGGISLVSLLLWMGSDRASAMGSGVISPMMLMVPLSATAVLGMSSTISLSVLCAQLFAASAAVAVLGFILGKMKFPVPRLAMNEVLGLLFILPLLFLLEGYFFADVPPPSLLLIADSMAVPGIAGMVSKQPAGEGVTGRPALVITGIAGIMNLAAIAAAFFINGL